MTRTTVHSSNTPLRKSKCATCPFIEGSKYSYLVETLTDSSKAEGRICHSTGSDNAINKRTGFPPYICRGSRDFQLGFIHSLGMTNDKTDEAWDDLRVKMGMERTVIEDPQKKINKK